MQLDRTSRLGIPSRARRLLLLAGATAFVPSVAWGQAASQFQYLFDTPTALGASSSMGGFAYDAATNSFWTAGFGSGQAIRRVTTADDVAWTGNTYVNQSDWVTHFLASSSTTENGGKGTILPSNYSSASVLGGMVLNPAPLTVGGITYQPGTLAIFVDQATVRNTDLPSSQQPQPQYSKIVYSYDLRAVTYDPITDLPNSPANGGRDNNGDGFVEWNDPFVPIVATANAQAVQGTTATSMAISRRPVFSGDGQSLYFNDSGSNYGGIWKVNLTSTGQSALTKIVDSRSGTQINTELAVVPTTTHHYGAAGSAGDQVFFRGSTDTGNVGGINYVVDAGTSVSAPTALLTAKQFAAFYEATNAAADVRTITSDDAGNLYMYNVGTGAGAYMYDADHGLVKVASEAEHRYYELSKGASYSTSVLDSQVRVATVATSDGGTAVLPQMLVNDNGLRTVIAITVFQPGDFNRDGAVDSTDVDDLQANLGLRGQVVGGVVSTGVKVGSGSTTTTWSDFGTDKLAYDLNGSGLTTSVTVNGNTTTTVNTYGVAVDWKDVKIFQRFAGLSDGDVNMDFAVDATDLDTLAANYNGTGKLFTQGNLTSVRVAAADRDDVNFADLVTLAANWTLAKPALGAVGSIPQADLDRAFAITSGGSISQYSANASGTWGNSANWTNGVPDAPGAVAGLLTKPQDDTTISVDGVRTVGQLNFDNYFNYTLTGGTIRLEGAGGVPAELNTFAASPIINSSLTVASDATVTVTDEADTVTVGGPLTIDAGAVLTKAGSGALKITGGGTSAGSVAITAGSLEIAANTTLGALTGNGSGALSLTGTATTLTISPSPAPTTVKVASLSMAAGTTLDLTTNRLFVNSGDPAVATALVDLITASFHGGLWDLPGMTSSSAAGDPNDLTGIGYLAGASSFQAALTFYGDANLDGVINADDYVLFDRGLAKQLAGWMNGDFNYSGTVDTGDLLMIDRGFAFTHPGALSADFLARRQAEFGVDYVNSLLAAVPEPSSMAALAFVAAISGGRRRRR